MLILRKPSMHWEKRYAVIVFTYLQFFFSEKNAKKPGKLSFVHYFRFMVIAWK